jgi:hypothetical protein
MAHQHRFLDLLPHEARNPAPVPAVLSSGFMVCPLVLRSGVMGTPWQQQLYSWAFEQARAVVRPTIVERYQMALNN